MKAENKARKDSVWQKIVTILVKIFDISYRILWEYSKYVLLVIVLIVSMDVVSRNVLQYSILWVQEVSLLLIVWMTFLAMAIGSEKDLHISIDLFYNKLPQKMQKAINLINRLVVVAIGIFLGFYGWKLAMSTWKSTLAVTKFPAGMLYLMVPLGGWSMTFFMILDLLGLKPLKKTDYNEDEDLYMNVDAVLESMTVTAKPSSADTKEK